MKIPFIDYHILAFLKNSQGPLDQSLQNYFKSHKSLGANDRKIIGNTVFGMMRWKSLLESTSSNREEQLKFYRNFEKGGFKPSSSLPKHLQYGTSLFLFEKLKHHFGEAKAEEISLIMNTQAPTAIRVNTAKISREALFNRLKEKFSVSLSKQTPSGILLSRREPLFSLPEFQEGLFEVQDEGSQIIASMVDARPKDLILDYCSGSGGKSLAFAPNMNGQGQIFLHDIREKALEQAKKRLKRAAVQNGQLLSPNHPQLEKLKQKCHWVLADVPCSGSGTLRRNPDQKWNIGPEMLHRLVLQQQTIFHKALEYLHPKGRLVYATCSLFPEENQEQVDYFLRTFPLELIEVKTVAMQEGGPDGFFGAVFRKLKT